MAGLISEMSKIVTVAFFSALDFMLTSNDDRNKMYMCGGRDFNNLKTSNESFKMRILRAANVAPKNLADKSTLNYDFSPPNFRVIKDTRLS